MPLFVALMVSVSGVAWAQPSGGSVDLMEQRAALEVWTACIADAQPDRVASVLVQDFKSRAYGSQLERLGKTDAARRCWKRLPEKFRRVELGGLPFAGGLAERMIERAGEPLTRRMSSAARIPGALAYSPSDAIAMCLVRDAPQKVEALFATVPVSAEEASALEALQPVAANCTSDGTQLKTTALGLRSMLATATFRMLAAAGAAQ